MQIRLYKFAKLLNSTATPDADGESSTALLKDSSPKDNPVFVIHRSKLKDYNYMSAQFDDETVYYFINSPTYLNNDLVEIPCTIDYLATYKNAIITSEQFIERSSDPELYAIGDQLTDGLYPSFNGIVTQSITQRIYNKSAGHYSVGIICSGISHPITQRGAVSYVIMSEIQLAAFIKYIMELDGAEADANPLQYIVSCTFLPFNLHLIDYFENENEDITFNEAVVPIRYWYPVNEIAQPDHGLLPVASISLTVPQHSLVNSYGKFLNYSPWLKARINIPAFGMYDLPLEYFTPSDRSIFGSIVIDLVDGTAVLQLFMYDYNHRLNNIIINLNGIVGVPVQLAQIVSNTKSSDMGVGMQLMGSLVSAIQRDAVGSAMGLASAVKSSYESQIPAVSSTGSTGSMAALADEYITLIIEEFTPCDIDVMREGKLVCRKMPINSGNAGHFIKCRNAKLQISANRDEIEAIENIMNEGFYYE